MRKENNLAMLTVLWVRFETEFRAGDIEIPLDILLYPSSYLGGAYPICKAIFKTEAKRMDAKTEQ